MIAMRDATPELARCALAFIPANLPRDEWARVGMAIKSAFPDETGFALFDEWSGTDADGYKPKDVRSTWQSVRAAGGVTIATLIHLAKQNGFTLPMDGAAPRATAAQAHRARERAEARAREQAEQTRRHCEAASSALVLWKACEPVAEFHYLTVKGIKPHGVRFNGASLVVPVRDTSGTLYSLQTIGPDGEKRFMPGGRVRGCYHAIGRPSGRLIVCEGYATGATLHEATGGAVAVAFNDGNLQAVAVALRAKYPCLTIVVAADDDWKTAGNPGLTAARQAAQAVGGKVAVPDFTGLQRGDKDTDYNDLHRLAGAVRIGGEA